MNKVTSIARVLIGLMRVRDGVKTMYDAYEENEELNNLQPASFSKVCAASLDEWYSSLIDAVDDWFELAGLNSRACYYLDDKETNIMEFIAENEFSDAEIDEICKLKTGKSITYGGGAMAESVLKRVA